MARAFWQRSLLLSALVLLFQGCEKAPPPPAVTQNQKDIKARAEAYAEAFNTHDQAKLTSLWDEDAFFINLTTEETVEGRENIAGFFKKLFDEKGAKNVKMILSDVSSSSPNEALAQGIVEISFIDRYDWKGAFKAEYRKHDENWFIKSFSVNEIDSSESQFNHLKELDWLAGNWIDADNPIEVEYSNLWDKNKNFLIQNFTYSVLGQEELKGMQIIGWNPVEKKISSWTFDSDGGYGQGVWRKKGSKWYVQQEMVLPRGGKATSINTYELKDDRTYSFLDSDRNVDGKKLPDIGPFKIVRH